MNNSAMNVYHQVDLHLFKLTGQTVYSTRTSETENNSVCTDYVLKDSSLTLRLPPYSITTVVLPLSGIDLLPNDLLTGTPYLIIPRTASLPLRSTAETVSIDTYVYRDSSQLWTLTAGATGYYIRNLAGRTLTDAGVYNMVASSSSNLSGQLFNLESVGDGCYRILSQQTGNAFDLSGENNTAGTVVGLYSYGASPAASHRQWMFVLPTTSRTTGAANTLSATGSKAALMAIDAGQAVLLYQTQDLKAIATIYNLTGKIVFHQEIGSGYTRVPLQTGIYIVTSMPIDGGAISTCKVLVH
jgi:hypothetical protein